MLGRRLISAAIIISVMLVLLRIDFWLGSADMLGRPGLILCALGIIIAGLTAGEMVHLWQAAPDKPNMGLTIVSAVVMVAVSFMPVLWVNYPADCPIRKFGWSFSGLIIAMVITFFYEMWQYRNSDLINGNGTNETHETHETRKAVVDEQADLNGQAHGLVTSRIGRSALVFVYLHFLFGFLVPHRMLDGDNAIGLIAVITLIATVKLSDSFAYFAGKSFGTIKIAPKLSPKKTLQGAVGAVVGGCVAVAICIYVVAPNVFGVTIEKEWWWFIVYGLLVTFAGMMGDLAESLLKRDSQTKDSGTWLPGLGGTLDVLDSLIFAAPVSFIVWLIGN